MSVDVESLTHRYGDRTALSDVTFSVPSGELFAIVGPNGGGKSTLLRILSTALRPTSGKASLLGIDLVDAYAVRRRLGVVFQSPALDGKLTVRENLIHHGHLYRLEGKELTTRIDETLERFGVADRAEERVDKLSGGLKRRVELGKGLLHRPEVLLLDEPTTGLDPSARREFGELVRGLEGVTVVWCTHLLEEAERCSRVAFLHLGKIVAIGEPDDLRGEIGGDIVTLRAKEPNKLAADILDQMDVASRAADGEVRLSHDRGHEFAAQLAEKFGGRFDSITVGRPSLEDVFQARTGDRFSDG